MSSLFLTLLMAVLALLVFCVVWLLWRDWQRGQHIAALDKTLKGALESQAMICGLIQKAAGRSGVKKSTAGKGK